MATNRWQIRIGLILLGCMLLSAAFALGVYVGEHGWMGAGESNVANRPGPAGQAPGQMPANPPQGQPIQGNMPQMPGQIPGFLPSGQPQGQIPGNAARPPDVSGRIQMISDSMILIKSPRGTRQVLIGAETVFQDENGAVIERSDLKKGDIIGVYGLLLEGDDRNLQAQLVMRLPMEK